MSRFKSDDLGLLLPSFRVKMEAVIADMTAKGYDCVPFDTLRTKAEAAKNAARGTGRPDSMHCYGVACDCICGVHGWSCAEHGCEFFEDYIATVEAHGLVSGANFDRDPRTKDRLNDQPHAQGCTLEQQHVVRAIADWDARDAYVKARLCA